MCKQEIPNVFLPKEFSYKMNVSWLANIITGLTRSCVREQLDSENFFSTCWSPLAYLLMRQTRAILTSSGLSKLSH